MCLGVTGLKEDDKEYGLMLGDTVVIEDTGAVAITPSKKKIRSVSIFLKVYILLHIFKGIQFIAYF